MASHFYHCFRLMVFYSMLQHGSSSDLCLSSEPLHALCHASDPNSTTWSLLPLPSAILPPHCLPPYRSVWSSKNETRSRKTICLCSRFSPRLDLNLGLQCSRRLTYQWAWSPQYIGFLTTLLKARHEELIIWKLDKCRLLLRAFYEVLGPDVKWVWTLNFNGYL